MSAEQDAVAYLYENGAVPAPRSIGVVGAVTHFGESTLDAVAYLDENGA